jgi:integrase
VWWYRRRLPDALAAAVGRREVWLSLRTSRLRLARRRADEVDAWLSLAFTQARAPGVSEGARKGLLMDTRKGLEELTRRWMRETLDEWESDRASGLPVSDAEVVGFDVGLDELRDSLESCKVLEGIASLGDELLAREARTLAPQDRALFLRLLTRAWVEVIERQQARTEGDYSGEPPLLGHAVVDALPPMAEGSPEMPSGIGPTVSEATALYVSDHDGKSWTDKTAGQAKVALRYFEEVVGGDTPLRSVTKDDVRRYREALEKLPARAGSTLKYRGKTLAEILATNDPPGLGSGQINTYVRRNVGGLFNWAVRMDYVEKNIAQGMTRKVRKDARDDRDVFTDADLASIFSADFANLRRGSRPEDFWLPLLMLHTGARNEEIAQLATDDVEEIDGVLCIQIRADHSWQQLKTPGSRRKVPVHPVLVKLGFLDYVEQVRRARHERVFPLLSKGPNRFHDAASRRFNRRLRALGINGKKSAYSLRHTFGTRLRDVDVQPETISELMGHAHQTMTMGRYVKAPSPRRLLEAVSRLDTRGVLAGLLGGP